MVSMATSYMILEIGGLAYIFNHIKGSTYPRALKLVSN